MNVTACGVIVEWKDEVFRAGSQNTWCLQAVRFIPHFAIYRNRYFPLPCPATFSIICISNIFLINSDDADEER